MIRFQTQCSIDGAKGLGVVIQGAMRASQKDICVCRRPQGNREVVFDHCLFVILLALNLTHQNVRVG